MCVARLHWIPGPLDELSTFSERSFPLRQFQAGLQALVLVVPMDRHHMRVTNDFVPGSQRNEMMNKTNQAVSSTAGKRAQRPATCLPRNYQVAPGGNL